MENVNQNQNQQSTHFLHPFKKTSKYAYNGYDKYGRLKQEVLEYLKLVENFDYSKKGMYRKVERIAETLRISQRKIYNIRKFCNDVQLTFTVKNTYKKLQTTTSVFLTDFCRAYFAELRRRAELRVLNPKIQNYNNNNKNQNPSEDSKLLLSKGSDKTSDPKIALLESQVASLSEKLEKALHFLSSQTVSGKEAEIAPSSKDKQENKTSIIDPSYLSRRSPFQRHLDASMVTLAKDVIGANGIPNSYRAYLTPDLAETISLSKTQMADVIKHMIKNGRYIPQSEIYTPASFKKYFEEQYEKMTNPIQSKRVIEEIVTKPEVDTSWTTESRQEALDKLLESKVLVPKEEVTEEVKTERAVPNWFSQFTK